MDSEKAIAAFWKQHKIFERSVQDRPADHSFSFYDGPPFATGLPHYGHIVASTIKDVIPRYQTMRGCRVERRWGWDCHGLPVENLIEQELGLKIKQDIETIGVAKFNDTCKTSVLKYTQEWRDTIERLGRFVDMEHDYRTMDPEYMESVWWVFKTLYDKGLIYEGKKAMHICPRCVTPLSNFEVTLGYKEVQDTAVTWKFEVVGQDHTYLLAWTTTPWSTPGTTGLSVGPDYTYVKIKSGAEYYYLVKDRIEAVLRDVPYTVLEEMKGKNLIGLRYKPIEASYSQLSEVASNQNVYQVFGGDYVDVTEGTGIVTINGSYGEVDMQAALRNQLPLIIDVDMDGRFNAQSGRYQGLSTEQGQQQFVKNAQDNHLVFRAEPYRHSYPHCWRCDTKLLNYATTSWFVRVTQLKDDMLKNNAQVNWLPEHVKQGRFGKWLEGAKDWAISRERYWGAPLPIWKSTDGDVLCVGSIAELKALSGVAVTDLHKQYVDDIVIHKDGKDYRRIGAVLDCWFESGAMPYAQNHWLGGKAATDLPPGFPADFIAEGLDQTRGWFYTLMVLSTALYDKPAFQQVIVNGLVLAEDGKKMSKRLKNYPEPSVVMDKYGADALRFYLMSSPVVKAEDLRFSEKGVDLVMKKVLLTLRNVVSFYTMFATGQTIPDQPQSHHIMDQWILAYTQDQVRDVTLAMDNYDLATATALIEQYIHDLSTWYIRRSRARFKDPATQLEALATLRYVLLTVSKLMAPFTPFIAEEIYQVLFPTAQQTGDSIHLQLWPEVNAQFVSGNILETMGQTRGLVEQILALREQHGIKVRQPLVAVVIPQLPQDYVAILLEEVNIKQAQFGDVVKIDIVISPELKEEGTVRELVRQLNALRKKLKFTIHDQKKLVYCTTDDYLRLVVEKHCSDLKKNTLVHTVEASHQPQAHIIKVDTVELSVTLED